MPERWGGSHLAGSSAPAGGGAELLACIVPGREPCFLLPTLPDGGRERGASPAARGSSEPAEADRGKDRRAGGT